MSNFAQYGKKDPTAIKQRQFINEIQSQYGSHSTDHKEYYSAVKNWRNLLVPATPERRKEIILGSLKLDVIADAEEIKSIDEAFSRMDRWIKSISERTLTSFFANQETIHDAMIAYKNANPNQNYGLNITTLVGDILFHDRKLVKKEKCPPRFWDESRIELEEVPCEHTKVEGTGTHRKDCKQYHLSQECDWRDTGYQVGVGRQKFQADLRHMNQIKFRAIGTFITKCLKEYEWDEVLLMLAQADNFRHPDWYKNPEYETLFEFSDDEKDFLKYFFSEYKHWVDKNGNVFTSMKDEYVDIDSEFLEEEDFKVPSDDYFKGKDSEDLLEDSTEWV